MRDDPREHVVPPVASSPAPLAPLPLADGELDAATAGELRALLAEIETRSAVQCGAYKEKCVRRRIAVRMRARAVHRYADYLELVRRDPAEYDRLLDTLTINVSKFFRDREMWAALEALVLPRLFALESPEVRIWSAGCAGGEEPYTVAVALQRYAEANGLTGRLDRFRILATDIDRDSLDAARRGEFNEFSLGDTTAEERARWFLPGRPARLRPGLGARVEFGYIDLTRGPYPAGQHLVLCRNVLIYFERVVQEAVLQAFGGAIAPGGHLVLGKVEAIFGPAAPAFRALAPRERIYQRA